ncbi:APC family permease [Streptomyces sp. VRA16 Mangrove soil]|uniref:APC family permease n=1 Tax=Streptomyces sp. VRA16 Mangrove soil TaxID=2817434 RepID=UPI001A9FE549|nr:APC family permease [Streptomyces sp. VRA16 Mangrove soil]MBO1332074.1 APC family permease [Streptomyces sp. VRA16 Mangrove soil]
MRSQSPGLRRSLGVVDGIAVAASSTAATTSIGIGMGSLAATVGLQAPAILLVAFVPILGIATAYARLNRHEQNMGSGYVWVGRSLGPWLGFLTGWVTLVGTLVFMAYTSAVTGSVFLQFANKAHLHSLLGLDLDPNSTALSTAVGLVVLTAVTVTAVTGIRKATRLQTWLLVFEYVVLIGFCGWSLVTGDHAFQWSWLNPFAIHDSTGFAQGLVLAVFFFWGWDAAFSVTEETKDVRDAGRGGFIALFTMLALFLYGSVAFQREMSLSELMEQGPQALTYLGAKLADEPLASLPLLALLFSAVASVQASVIPTARGLLAMGRDRTMGQVWTRISPRYGSPAIGTVLVMAIAAVISVLALAIPKLNEMILAAVNSIGLIVALYYGLTALACAVRFRSLLRTDFREATRAVLAPGLSALALLGIGAYLARDYATMSDHFELSPDNGWFMLAVPIAIVVSGLAMAAVAKYGRRSPYFTSGRGTDADALPLTATELP